jgi:large repetitive protein
VLFDQGINDTTYQITLGVVNLCGASYYQDSVLVYPQPVANFGISPESNCTPVIINFANVSSGSPTSFLWDFGNGNTSTDSIPGPQSYTTDSTIQNYTITLTAFNQCGFDTAQQVITVEPADVQSFFNVSTLEGCEPLTVEFYDFSTPGANIDWDFGDGNTSSLPNTVHTFEEPGEYTVVQYATNLCGFDSTSVMITVNPIPEVSFSHLPSVCMGQEIEFTNTSINTSGHFWDFGDGDTSLLNNPVHVFQTPGFHTVTLVGVSTFNQCTSTFESEIYVLPAPTASFEPSETNGCVPFSIGLENNSLNAAFFEWDFGDGNVSVLENPAHIYYEEGTYPISLIVTDEQGCFNDTTVFNIQVHPKPTADFTFEREHLCGTPVDIYFKNQSEGADGYLWNFGDGNQSFLTEPTHTFNISGHFLTELMVSTAFGCKDTFDLEVSVYPQPIADFDIETAKGCAPLQVFFNNESAGSDLYFWEFGDGAFSEEPNPVHTFIDPGFYDVQLIATSENVCFDTIDLNDVVEVLQTPIAYFEYEELAEGIFQMNNLSQFANTYFWDFSDGTSSDLENPAHRFLTNGVKQIYLEASSQNGCVDDTLISITPTVLKALYVPSGFSPEQGIGEVRLFKPKGVGLKEYHMQVFSTYGQLIWESREIDEGQPVEAWDGTYKGKILPQDVYVWKAFAIFEDGTSWRGNIDEAGNYKTMGSVILLR